VLDRVADTFQRAILADGYLLTQYSGPDGCSAQWPNPDADENALRRNGLLDDPCRYILPRRDYYEWLMGVPMVALEGDFSFRQIPSSVNIGSTTCKEIELVDSSSNLEWYFYINEITHRLEATRFTNTNGGGEWLYYPQDTVLDGYALKTVQRWTRLDQITPLVTDSISWSVF
jgi:hypothetical protein